MVIINITSEQLKTNIDIKKTDNFLKFKIEKFIKTFGILKPLIVIPDNEQYLIIDGNKIFEISKQIGIKNFPCVILNKRDDIDFVRLMLNITSFENNLIELSTIISKLNDEQIDCLPFNSDMIETFKTLLEFNWNQYHEAEGPKQIGLI